MFFIKYLRWKHWGKDKYIQCSTYPPDWHYRRVYVYLRDKGKCAQCGKVFYPSKLFTYFLGIIPRGVHIHHIQHISNGGNHDLNNLKCFCEDCHGNKIGHKQLKYDINYRKLYFGYKAKITKSRQGHICGCCKNHMASGDHYYGGKYDKICMNCYKRMKTKHQ